MRTEREAESKIEGDRTVCVASDCLHREVRGTYRTLDRAEVVTNVLLYLSIARATCAEACLNSLVQ